MLAQAAEHVDLMEQRRILDHDRVGMRDRLVAANGAIVNSAEGDDRRPGALRSKARKRLRMTPVEERG